MKSHILEGHLELDGAECTELKRHNMGGARARRSLSLDKADEGPESWAVYRSVHATNSQEQQGKEVNALLGVAGAKLIVTLPIC